MSKQQRLNINLIPSPPPEDMRRRRFSALAEPQELFVDTLVGSGSTWLIENGDAPAGYVVIGDDGVLLEAFYDNALVLALPDLFQELVATADLKSALVQTFDASLLALATAAHGHVTTSGLLFRTITDPGHTPRSDVSMRPATTHDVDAVAVIGEGFFDSADEIRSYLGHDGLFVLQSQDQTLLGCGVAKPVIPGGTDIDIGMVVAPRFRRRGYGAFIVSYLKATCIAKGLRLICGCAVTNVGSQRTLQKAGFAADHRLLSFTY